MLIQFIYILLPNIAKYCKYLCMNLVHRISYYNKFTLNRKCYLFNVFYRIYYLEWS